MDQALKAVIGADIKDFKDKLDQAKSTLSNFQDSIGEIAQTIGVAFGIREVGNFALEITKLAGQADGVRQAFNKLDGAQAVLIDLKEATRGTVSELDLMKSAVQASNFKIPIEQLGSLFEFAYERAKATGQSVDYLVQSIVTGIGRKSPLILDNLGISAVALKEKLGGVSTEAASIADVAQAVGKIASEELTKMGGSAETAAEKIAKIGATWEDIKDKLGQKIAPFMSGLLTNFNNQLTVWADESIPLWKKILGNDQDYQDWVNEIKKKEKAISDAAKNSPEAKKKKQDAENMALAEQYAIRPAPGPAGTRAMSIYSPVFSGISQHLSGILDTTSEDQAFDETVQKMISNLQEIPESTAEADKAIQEHFDKIDQLRQAYDALGYSIGNNLAAAITGHQSFAGALKNIVADIVAMHGKQAIMAVIAGSAEKAAFLGPGAVAVAAAAAAAMAGLIRSFGVSVSGGGSGSPQANRSSNLSLLNGNVQSVQVYGVIRGSDLYLLGQNYAQQGTYLRPG